VQVSFSSNIDSVLRASARLDPQFRFAAAKALTDTMRDVQLGLPGEAVRVFEGGAVDFTRRGFYLQAARKDNLVASVGVKDKQAAYLQYQIEGGRRAPRKRALRLPSVVQLTAQGNLPTGLIRTLIARAKAGKRATAGQAKRFGVSRATDLFYGEPGDGRPAGIYKRVVLSAQRHQLVPIVVMPKTEAHYTDRRFDFYGFADRTFRRGFEANLDRAWKYAQATAR
jgi:hypothetical protein